MTHKTFYRLYLSYSFAKGGYLSDIAMYYLFIVIFFSKKKVKISIADAVSAMHTYIDAVLLT